MQTDVCFTTLYTRIITGMTIYFIVYIKKHGLQFLREIFYFLHINRLIHVANAVLEKLLSVQVQLLFFTIDPKLLKPFVSILTNFYYFDFFSDSKCL